MKECRNNNNCGSGLWLTLLKEPTPADAQTTEYCDIVGNDKIDATADRQSKSEIRTTVVALSHKSDSQKDMIVATKIKHYMVSTQTVIDAGNTS